MTEKAPEKAPEKAKGKRPGFAADPAVDRLVAMLMALTGEVSVLADRVDTLERLLAAAGTLPADAVESFEPDADASAARERRRAELLDRVLWILRADLTEDEAGETEAGYRAVVRALEQAD